MKSIPELEAKDVLHLYLGQWVMLHVQSSAMTKAGFENGQYILSGEIYQHAMLQDCRVELILRPLSSMTEEEAAQIADIVIGSYDSVKWKVKKKFKVVNEIVTNEFIYFDVHKKHRGYSKSLTIDERGEIDVYDDETIDQYMHQHLVTAFLLSKGFDIFDLHSSGGCLYETDLTK